MLQHVLKSTNDAYLIKSAEATAQKASEWLKMVDFNLAIITFCYDSAHAVPQLILLYAKRGGIKKKLQNKERREEMK